MKNIFNAGLLILLAPLLYSCGNKLHDSALLANAEHLITSNPDSTLILLESIKHPEHLNQRQQAVYFLLQTEAKDRTHKDISNDDLLKTIDYFEKEKNYNKIAYAYFYQNRIFESQSQTEQAIRYCCLSKKYAEKVGNLNLLGLIYHDLGCLYKEQYNFTEALDKSKESLKYFLKNENKRQAIYMCNKIGDIYLVANQKDDIDSALVYYQKALDYAQYETHPKEFYDIYLSISLHLCESNFFEDAKSFGKKARKITDNVQTNTNLSGIYINLNKPDSALFFFNKAYSTYSELDLKEKYIYKKLLYRINYITHNYQTAISNLHDCLTYKDSIYNEVVQQKILEIQKKYEKEYLENERNELLIERLYYIICCLFLTLSISVIIVFFKYKSKKQKLELLKAQQNLNLLREMLQTQNNNSNQLKQFFLKELNIAKKVAQMTSRSNQSDSAFIKQYHFVFGHNIAENLNWDKNLYTIFNGLYNNFADKIKNIHPSLTEKELQLCCLIKADFSKEEIGLILSYESDSIKTIRTRIWKKLGFDNNEDFIRYIVNLQ